MSPALAGGFFTAETPGKPENPLLSFSVLYASKGLPWWLSDKESTSNAGDTGDVDSILELENSSGGGHGTPLPYSCLENPMDRGAWWATVHGVTKSRTRLKQCSVHAGSVCCAGIRGKLHGEHAFACLQLPGTLLCTLDTSSWC